MHPIDTDVTCSVVCRCVCLTGTWSRPAKMAEPIEMPFGGADSHGPKKDVVDGI